MTDASSKARPPEGPLPAVARPAPSVGPGSDRRAQAAEAARAGEAATAAGRWAEACDLYARAVALAPGESAFHVGLGAAATSAGRLDLARAHLHEAVRLAPSNAAAFRHLGLVSLYSGLVDEALAFSARAVALAPADPGHAIARTAVLEAAGRFDEAWQMAQQVRAGGWVTTHFAVTYAKLAPRFGQARRALDLAEHLIVAASTSAEHRANLHFAAGDLLDGMGQYDEAFTHYRLGNLGKRATMPAFDPAGHAAWTDAQIALFTRDRLAAVPRPAAAAGGNGGSGPGGRSELPVFIVGMPRSGTSLVEQIVASHPAVHGAGEIDLLGMMLDRVPRPPGPADGAARLAALTPATVEQLAAAYLGPLRALAGGRPGVDRVTNKTPLNFLHLGWVAAILPGARVIHCTRDPMDTCLSCYLSYFTSGHQYIYDLTVLGRFYRDYRRLMDHWRAALDLPILDVGYEALVADPAGQSRRVVEFLGLEWDDRCLAFDRNPRYTNTISYNQVRRPVYASSVGRWRNYERHLDPLRTALGDLA